MLAVSFLGGPFDLPVRQMNCSTAPERLEFTSPDFEKFAEIPTELQRDENVPFKKIVYRRMGKKPGDAPNFWTYFFDPTTT